MSVVRRWGGAVPRRAVAAVALGGNARVELWHMLADLVASEMEIEVALGVTIASYEDQGRSLVPTILKRWQRVLLEGRPLEREIALWVPATESMVLQGLGTVEAGPLLEAAARIAEARVKQMGALWSALAMPLALALGIVVSLWLSGSEFVPVMLEMVPVSRMETAARVFTGASSWVHGNATAVFAGIAGGGALLAWLTLTWTGLGRTLADRVPPFSLYRTVAGSSFLFVAIELLRSGVDLNEATFGQLKSSGSRYTRSRIGAIEARMKQGLGLGRAMVDAGQGFPDPALVAVVAALDGKEGWEEKLAAFVARWSERSEQLLKRRTAVLNMVLMVAAAVAMGIAIKALFGLMKGVGQGAVP